MVRNRIATLAWAGLVAGLLLAPGGMLSGSGLDEVAADLPYLDKIVHAALFGVLAWLASRSLRQAGVRRARVVALVAVAAYGGVLELLQPLVLRDADLLDALANTAGALAAALLTPP